jgi:hypothetical protein
MALNGLIQKEFLATKHMMVIRINSFVRKIMQEHLQLLVRLYR